MSERDSQSNDKPRDSEIISAFSNGGGPDDQIPTHQPHAPLLTNEQIIWVVRRFLAGRVRSAGPINLEGHAGDADDVGSMIAAGITRAAAAADRLITINNIERFHAGEERLEADPDGPWVRFSDAAAISNRLASATRSAGGESSDFQLRERLRLAMNFIEEWSNWWSYALGVDDSKPMSEAAKAEGERMAASLGERGARMVVENRHFLNVSPRIVEPRGCPTPGACSCVVRSARTESVAIDDIAAERQRQIEKEGWNTEHDDDHSSGELALAAACYAAHAADETACNPAGDSIWPWQKRWWKPKDPRRDLVRAAALIVAEIERMDRATQ